MHGRSEQPRPFRAARRPLRETLKSFGRRRARPGPLGPPHTPWRGATRYPTGPAARAGHLCWLLCSSTTCVEHSHERSGSESARRGKAARPGVVSQVHRACRGIRTRMRVPADLFTPRAVPVGQNIRSAPAPRPRSGPPDDELLALSAGGLTLRQIAERVGVSHETVRQRLCTTAPGDRQFCPGPVDPSAIVSARKSVGGVALPELREGANGESPGGSRRAAR